MLFGSFSYPFWIFFFLSAFAISMGWISFGRYMQRGKQDRNIADVLTHIVAWPAWCLVLVRVLYDLDASFGFIEAMAWAMPIAFFPALLWPHGSFSKAFSR